MDLMIDRVYTTWIKAFRNVELNLNRPKFHCLRHMRMCIERHGCLLNSCTSPFEHEHIAVHGLHTSTQRGFGDNDSRMVCKVISDRQVRIGSIEDVPPPVKKRNIKYDADFCKVFLGVSYPEFEDNNVVKRTRKEALFIHPQLQFRLIHDCLARYLNYGCVEDMFISDEIKD